MKIILTESQTSRLITLLENKSFEDYINDLDEIIDSRETHRKGMNNYSFTKGVAAIQAGLDKLGYGFSTFGIDGKYGNETEKNVKKFHFFPLNFFSNSRKYNQIIARSITVKVITQQ